MLDVRDGAKGPLIVEILKRRVAARTDKRQQAPDEVLVAIRYRDRDNQRVVKTDYYLSNASVETPLPAFARVAKAEHRIEECLQRCKSEAGLGDYEVRNWVGWQHHQTLSLIATWFLAQRNATGEKNGHPRSRFHKSAKASRKSCIARPCDSPSRIRHERETRLKRNELARLYHWKQRNYLAPLNIRKRQI